MLLSEELLYLLIETMSEHRLDRIVIERPRWGWRVSSQKRLRRQIKQQLQQAKYDYEDAELDTIKCCNKKNVRGIKSKSFSDNLNPLYQWLHSKVGQPWDRVYNELAQVMDFSTLAGQHILTHVWGYVEREVFIIDDIPHTARYHYCREKRQARSILKPLGKYWKGKGELYIHPETGILSVAEIPQKKRSPRRQDYFFLDKYHQYHQLNGIWYLISFCDLPKPFVTYVDGVPKVHSVVVRDVLERQTITYKELSSRNHTAIYAHHKRQCNKKEIRWIEAQIAKQQEATQ